MIDVTGLKVNKISQIETDDGIIAIDFGYAPAGKKAAQELAEYTLKAIQYYAENFKEVGESA